MTGEERVRLCAAGNRDQAVDHSDARVRACAADGRRSDGLDDQTRVRLAAGQPIEWDDPLAKAISNRMGPFHQAMQRLSRPASLYRRVRRSRPLVVPAATMGRAQPAEPVTMPHSPDHPLAYWDCRDHLAAAIRTGQVSANAAALLAHAAGRLGVNRADAAEWVERFYSQLRRELGSRA